MSVDLPAPFSPMMPWIEPWPIVSVTSLLACTEPKRLSIPISSIAGVMFAPKVPLPAAGEEGPHREAMGR